MNNEQLPQIIQGGMGAGVSSWKLANATSRRGLLGVVSGTALDTIMIRRLQLGDADVLRALAHFPSSGMAERVRQEFFIAGGKRAEASFKMIPMPLVAMSRSSVELLIVSNFVEVFLAKEGHSGKVGINYLEKIQLPTLPSLLGAMLAGVDFVLMGAGLPLTIPGILDQLSQWKSVEMRVNVEDNHDQKNFFTRLDPREYFAEPVPALKRPEFLAIISSEIVAKTFIRRANGSIAGFVVEYPNAGGHNAPPRKGGSAIAETGSVFGPKDQPNLGKIAELGLPFWLAGSFSTKEKLSEARALGAHGIQVGTAFAFCDESGMTADVKAEVVERSLAGTVDVVTDLKASPTGYPFKVVALEDSIANPDHHAERCRVCDLGYLRQLYCATDGRVGYRCPGEPIKQYLAKGGQIEDTVGKQCLCNGLLATVGLGQMRNGSVELPLVTAGEDVRNLARYVRENKKRYTANDVIDSLLN